jgi:hypothetical protein
VLVESGRPRPTLPSLQKLLVVRRCVRERVIEATAIPFRGVHKCVEIFLDIDRLEEQAFVTNLLGLRFNPARLGPGRWPSLQQFDRT